MTVSILLILSLILSIEVAHAHASSQGFVLLLPTDTYTLVGWLVVLITAVALVVLPIRSAHRLLRSYRLSTGLNESTQASGATESAQASGVQDSAQVSDVSESVQVSRWVIATSLLSTLLLFFLIYIGFTGTHDPLENLLPLSMWTGFWIALVLLHGLLGNLWHWVNPWSGVAFLLGARSQISKNQFTKPNSEDQSPSPNVWPAALGLLLFSAFVLSDPAPDDPERLALFVAAYWLLTLIIILIKGDHYWRQRGEFFSVLFRVYAWLAPLCKKGPELHFGLPSWRASSVAESKAANTSLACFVLILLGTGSFDGLNETFWWLSRIGVNPLEFPGRSAVILQTITGLVLLTALLIAAFACVVYTGHRLAIRGKPVSSVGSAPLGTEQIGTEPTKPAFKRAFNCLAISLLPIAFAYHLAHFLPTLLVNSQYLAVALGDPLGRGADLLGLAAYHVTTGFFNTLHTVRWILLTQVTAVVVGHVLAVLLAHASAIELYKERKKAALALLPLTLFMVLYTFLGLWLLATPRGA